MRRILVLIYTIVYISVMFCGCGSKLELGEEIFDEYNTFDGVTITIDHTTVSNIGLKFEILNTTDNEVCSGKPYLVSLQKEKDDRWYNIKTKIDSRDTTAESYSYYKNEPQIVEVNWTADHGELPKGHYRIVKYFFINSNIDNYGRFENFALSDDFSISE